MMVQPNVQIMKRSIKSLIHRSTKLRQHIQIQHFPIHSSSMAEFTENPSQTTNSNHTHWIESLSSRTHMNQILAQMIVSKTPINELSFTKLLDISIHSRGLASSALLFTQFSDYIDLELCNNMIRSYTNVKKHLYAVFVYTQMQKIGVLPNQQTFPAVLKSVAMLFRIELGKLIHCCVIKMGFDPNVYVHTAMVHMYCVCLSVVEGRRLFDEMPGRNPVTWNALISGYVHNRKFKEAIDVFRKMQKAGAEPDEVTVVGVLSACAHLGALNQGRYVHDYIRHNRLRLNVYVGTALIDMYAKCGVVDDAENVFHMMRVKNVYTWNVLISGYAMNGQGKAALQVFSNMLTEGFQPDEFTFLGVLCACSHQHLVDEGRRHFKSMKEEFGLEQTIEHYGCMVDLLGRAGFLNEAQELIQTMSLKPDPAIWRALLGACRLHGHTQLGEFAIRRLLELEPNNGENYVLLANLYVRERRWDKAGEVREMMEKKGIKKVPGCSSIEIENVVYEFKVSDSFEPKFEEVHELLDIISRKLRSAGYVLETDMVLYDMEEEEKEHSLMHHSEKLALAFGILRSPRTSTIRILKNLRVCHDCHEFFKHVSMVYGRYIILRDRNRFHHFEGGACSCNDYW